MSNELNNLLKKAYRRWRGDVNSPVPIETIKKFLELEGIELED